MREIPDRVIINFFEELDPDDLARVYKELEVEPESTVTPLAVYLLVDRMFFNWMEKKITPGLSPIETLLALYWRNYPLMAKWFYLQCPANEKQAIQNEIIKRQYLTQMESVTVALPFYGGIECVDRITFSLSSVPRGWQELIVDAMMKARRLLPNSSNIQEKSRVTLWTLLHIKSIESHSSRYHVIFFPITHPLPHLQHEETKVVLYDKVADHCITFLLLPSERENFLRDLFEAPSIAHLILKSISYESFSRKDVILSKNTFLSGVQLPEHMPVWNEHDPIGSVIRRVHCFIMPPEGARYKIILTPESCLYIYDAQLGCLYEPFANATPERVINEALTLINQPEHILDVLTLGSRIYSELNKRAGIPKDFCGQTREEILNAYIFRNFILIDTLIDDFVIFCQCPKEMNKAINLLMLFGFLVCVCIPTVILKTVIELPLIAADAVLEHACQRVANSKLHWASKAILQIPLHLGLALIVVPRLIIQAVLSPLLFLQNIRSQLIMFVEKLSPPKKTTVNTASLWHHQAENSKQPTESDSLLYSGRARFSNSLTTFSSRLTC